MVEFHSYTTQPFYIKFLIKSYRNGATRPSCIMPLMGVPTLSSHQRVPGLPLADEMLRVLILLSLLSMRIFRDLTRLESLSIKKYLQS